MWAVWGLTLLSCTSNQKDVTTKSGLKVNYISEGTGRSPVVGELLLLHMRYTDESGKVLFDSKDVGNTVPIMFDTARWKDAGMMYEVFSLLKVGDSVMFDVPAEDLFQKSFRSHLPDSIAAGSNITFILGVEDAMSQEAYGTQKNSGQLITDGKVIDDYLSENNIEAQTTASGLRYKLSQEGNGPNAVPGSQVSVHYSGTLLDGTKFDSSYDRGQPFSFVLGQGRVIMGWDEGIALLNKGAKATLYIPSSLAYGERGSAPTIGPNSVLKFDVELVDFQ